VCVVYGRWVVCVGWVGARGQIKILARIYMNAEPAQAGSMTPQQCQRAAIQYVKIVTVCRESKS
jgi:hypothetical protein